MLIYISPNLPGGNGKTMVRILRSGAAIALLMGAAVAAHAAGLGKLTVNSALGQILNAEIELVSVQAGELDALSARVAPPENFREARIEVSWPAGRIQREYPILLDPPGYSQRSVAPPTVGATAPRAADTPPAA